MRNLIQENISRKAFPMQVKYMKEVLHGRPILPEKINPEPTIINGNQEPNKQPEEFEPQVEMKKLPTEVKEIRSHYEVVKDAMYGEQEEVPKKPSRKKDSPGEYKPDNDDESDDEDLDEDEDEEEEEEEEAEVTTPQEQEFKTEEPPTFPYRLTLTIMGPDDQVLRHEKTGSISAAQDGSFKKDDMNSLLQYMRDTEQRECTPPKVAVSDVAEKLDKMQYPVHVSSPAIRYSSQTMDQKGNLYRQERMRPLPIAMMSYYQNSVFKAVQEHKTPESSAAKEVTNEPKTTNEIANEILPPKLKFEKETHMREVGKKLKPVDTKLYPKKYDASVNFNGKVPDTNVEFKTESSDLKESDDEEDDDEEEEEEVKKVVIIRPHPRVFHASVELDGVSRKDGKTVKADVALEEMPVKKAVLSDRSQFSFRHVWAPLRQVLVSKIFGRPSVVNVQP